MNNRRIYDYRDWICTAGNDSRGNVRIKTFPALTGFELSLRTSAIPELWNHIWERGSLLRSIKGCCAEHEVHNHYCDWVYTNWAMKPQLLGAGQILVLGSLNGTQRCIQSSLWLSLYQLNYEATTAGSRSF